MDTEVKCKEAISDILLPYSIFSLSYFILFNAYVMLRLCLECKLFFLLLEIIDGI